MTGDYRAVDNLRHNGVTYKAGEVLDRDDFSKNQLTRLLEDGVIEAVADAEDIDDADGADNTADDNSKPVAEKPKNSRSRG